MSDALHTIHGLDQDITLLINGFHTFFTDHVFLFLSKKWFWVPLYGMIVVYLFYRLGWKKALVCIASIVLTIVACDQFANLIKDGVARLRPCYSSRMLEGGLHMLEGRGNHFGFFSAHSANAFGLAVCSILAFRNDKTLSYRKYTATILTWATLVSISRIFAGKHYLGDVIVGILIGCLFGWVLGRMARWVIRRYIEKPAA